MNAQAPILSQRTARRTRTDFAVLVAGGAESLAAFHSDYVRKHGSIPKDNGRELNPAATIFLAAQKRLLDNLVAEAPEEHRFTLRRRVIEAAAAKLSETSPTP